MQANSFLDRVKIYVKAGKGGDGCLSFRREKFIEFGGPNGGNGGKGGDVILKAEPNLTTLQELAYNPHIEANDGAKGGTYNKFGLGADAKIVLVPLGTVVKKDGAVIADLTAAGQEIIIAHGGRGGRGNQSFKTHQNTAPRIAEIGQPGEEITLVLELKVLADVGLVGFPNAGKSTFLSAVSAARPKVADYPFTTLNPNLGICTHKGKSFVIADIPGIIEGAGKGKGLGHQFLKHIERTRVLLHLVDPAGFGGIDAVKSIKILEDELKTFSKDLAKKPRIIVVNKADTSGAEEVFEKIKNKYAKLPLFLISAAARKGLGKVLDETVKTLAAKPVKAVKPAQAGPVVHAIAPVFTITRLEEGRMQITGKKIEEFIAMTNFAQPQAVERLGKIFKKIGLEKALLKRGVAEGTTIIACGKEFEWNGGFGAEISAEAERIGGHGARESKAQRLAKRKARREKKKGLKL
ncbi:MAG: GTPase ObgE [Elusimicrobiota bacterium]|jgi:GTP-binding protein|nr:GTPase ObgE [Elusimicrobiota bacterium]